MNDPLLKRLVKDREDAHKQRIDNDHQNKATKDVQANEQTHVDKYSEGMCYGCNKIDLIRSSLYYICNDCYHIRGKELVMANLHKKEKEELCEICGWWKLDIWQRNVSFCESCNDRVIRIHKKYQKHGRKHEPFHRRLLSKYGSEYDRITGFQKPT